MKISAGDCLNSWTNNAVNSQRCKSRLDQNKRDTKVRPLCLIGILFLLLSAGSVAAQNVQGDRNELEIIKRLVLEARADFTLGYDYKNTVRLGDKLARELNKAIPQESLTEAKTLKACLLLLRRAFAQPNWIADPHDRSPKATLKLLQFLDERVSELELKGLIAETRGVIEQVTSKDPPNYVIGPISSPKLPLRDLLNQIAITYEIPIGLEGLTAESVYKISGISFSGGTVSDFMDQLCAANPEYTWGVIESAIFVVPADANTSPLECGVTKFAIQGASSAETVKQLSQLPEVESKLAKLGVSRIEVMQPAGEQIRLTLNLDGLRLHQILSQLVRSSRTWFWASYRDGSTLIITI